MKINAKKQEINFIGLNSELKAALPEVYMGMIVEMGIEDKTHVIELPDDASQADIQKVAEIVEAHDSAAHDEKMAQTQPEPADQPTQIDKLFAVINQLEKRVSELEGGRAATH
ncbi:MAG: hypothetical protein ABI947_02535 [Chloroflexota bacterium]